MRKKGILLLAVILIAGSAAYFALHGPKRHGIGEPTLQPVEATLGSISETVEATGEVMPLNRVEIKPPIAGRIEKLLMDEGDRVRAGEILAWMSSTDRASIIDAARAKGPDEVKKWQDTYKPT